MTSTEANLRARSMGDIITEAIAIDPSLSSSEVEEHLAFDCRTIKGLTQFLDMRGEEVG